MLVTTLDDIAWLLNLRGNDINFNPLFFSYLVFNNSKEALSADLFVDSLKVDAVSDYLKEQRVTVHPYESIRGFLKDMPTSSVKVDIGNCSFALYDTLVQAGHKVEKSDTNIIQHLKAKKNPVMQ